MKKYLVTLVLAAVFISVPVFSQSEILYPPFSKEIPPVNPNFNSEDEVVEYFEKTYRATWEKLSEFEQYAIAFSSNLFQLNKQYHLDFSGKTVYQSNQGNPSVILEKDWGIRDYDSLLEMFESLVTGGQSGSYKKLLAMLNQNPEKSVLDIALSEKLSILEVSRLYYVRDTHDYLGSHDIEAWDLGRAITILRWGIASDYISVEEATELCKPVVERLKQDYVSWYDFFVHYLHGRGFYGLYEAKSEVLMINAVTASSLTLNFIPLRQMNFPGENADKNHTFTNKYTLCISEQPDYIEWRNVQKLYSGKQTQETLKKLCILEEGDFSNYSNLFFDWHVELLSKYGNKLDLVEYISNNTEWLDNYSKDDERFVKIFYTYLAALNSISLPQYVMELIEKLPPKLQYNPYFYYQYVNANYLMINLCETQEELDYYRKNAINGFKILKQNGFELPETQEAWLNHVD